MGYINAGQLAAIAGSLKDSSYARYLLRVLDSEH
jgi:hypothetical protein